MIEKILQHGPKRCIQVLRARIRKQRFFKNPHYQSKIKLNRKLGIGIDSLDQYIPSKNKIIDRANRILKNDFEIFGKITNLPAPRPWQKDFLLEKEFDIKVPWELSRFQFAFDLGYAYHKTKNELYAEKFKELAVDWIESNPYPTGINWKCPMDVAIRAINFIWAVNFFQNSKISESFWNNLDKILIKHFHYLENNWEIFFKNNNHYIADLLGYFYLCSYFKEKKKLKWCYKELIHECFTQIQSDGTLYEGSTCYHRLVTEMFLHFKLICKNENLPLSEAFTSKLDKMFGFLKESTDQGGNIVQIGDNDSGKLVSGIKSPPSPTNKVSHFDHFGITIVRSKDTHFTLRHPTYNKKQPTGHFHNDELSFTLSIQGIPVIVDPGTYLYTGSPKWRNLMRSKKMHNTFYTDKDETFPSLFGSNKQKAKDGSYIEEKTNFIAIGAHHGTKHRNVYITSNRINIKDFGDESTKYGWNLTFHPNISLSHHDDAWQIQHNGYPLAIMTTSLKFRMENSLYSAGYSQIQKTCTLKAVGKSSIITFDLLS